MINTFTGVTIRVVPDGYDAGDGVTITKGKAAYNRRQMLVVQEDYDAMKRYDQKETPDAP